MRAYPLMLAIGGLLMGTPVHACGVCTEDKVAATYDHALARRAASLGRVMVFCEVRGPLDVRRLKTSARRIKGLDPASLRISTNPPTLSFALDGRRQSPQAAVDRLQAVALPGAQLVIVHLLGGPAT